MESVKPAPAILVPVVLVVDDDINLVKVVEYNLTEEGYKVLTASSGEQGLEILLENHVDLVLTDIRMPGMDGMEFLRRIQAQWPNMQVILVTAFAAIDSAVEAIKAGAVDYIGKPFNKDDLKYKAKKALETRRLQEENLKLRTELAQQKGLHGIIGRSSAMRKVFDLVTHVAASDSTILITGASGTGKELVARAIHHLSHRSSEPWVAINCAAIPRDLLESDLFGHVRGAFTGAIRDHTGKFELADKGSIFLDEIGDIDISLQPKLLRVLQEHEVQRVGDTKTTKVNVRIIAATQENLLKKVSKEQFREDLFYRLNVIPINIPPLCERDGDVPLLAGHFMKKYAGDDLAWSSSALAALENYPWPGNVRELENLIERICVLSRGKSKEINVADLPPEITGGPGLTSIKLEAKTLPEAEKEIVMRALEGAHGNRSKAARSLGIPRHVLLYRIKKYKIE